MSNRIKKTHLLWILLSCLIFILPACRRGEETPTPVAGVQGQAFVDSLQVMMLESFPVQVQATVNGNLSNSCTTLTGVDVQQQGTVFVMTVQTIYNDTGACAQALVPFSQTVALNVLGLPAGTYTVMADGVSQSFTLAVDNVPGQTPAPVPDTGTRSLTPSLTSAVPGQAVTLTGQGFPANASIQIGMGLVNANIAPVSTLQSGADGRFTTQLSIPANATPGQQWVYSATVNGETVLSPPVTVVAEGATEQPPTTQPVPTATTGDGVNQAVNGLFNRTQIYLIALEDGGQSGPAVGCGDSVVPVTIDIEPTAAVMSAAYNRLLSIKDQNYGESGLYNALYQSNLTLAGINIVNREAIVNLTGTLLSGGTCDDPRILAQLQYVALQYNTVDRVTILLNGQPLTSASGPAGRG